MWITRTIEAPAATCWDTLIDTAQWPSWGPSVSSVRLATDGRAPGDRAGDGPGQRVRPRRIDASSHGWVKPAIGPLIPFRITSFEPGHCWAWSVANIPATAHRVEALGADRCRVGFHVPIWATPYAAICAIALRRIEGLATAGH